MNAVHRFGCTYHQVEQLQSFGSMRAERVQRSIIITILQSLMTFTNTNATSTKTLALTKLVQHELKVSFRLIQKLDFRINADSSLSVHSVVASHKTSDRYHHHHHQHHHYGIFLFNSISAFICLSFPSTLFALFGFNQGLIFQLTKKFWFNSYFSLLYDKKLIQIFFP